MSEDIKKSLRTQGKYFDNGNKYRDKRQKESPTDKEPPGKKPHPNKRSSNGSIDQSNSLTASETDSPVKYEESSDYKFDNLEEKKPTEVKTAGEHIISETFNGISTILYEPEFIDYDEGNNLYNELYDNTDWNTKNIVIRGQEYPQPRLVAWYGPFPYTYSGVTLEPAEMPECVVRLKDRIEDYLELKNIKVTLNSVLLNYYRNGQDSVAWHSDDELTMGICPTIASISLGETRKFEMRRKVESYDEEVSPDEVNQIFLHLVHGSLLIMNGVTQDDWQHRVPKEYHDRDGRINLTFRTVYSLETNRSGISFKDFKSKLVESNSSGKSCSAEICFDEGDFPPLGSPVCTSEKTPPSSHLLNPSMQFEVDEDVHDKSMDSIEAVISNDSMDASVAPVYFSSPHVNNLNEEINIDHVSDKNVNANDSFASDSDIMTTDDSMEKNASCGASYDFHGPTDSESKFENKMYADKITTNLNVEAREFVPIRPVPAVDMHQENNYITMDLWDLILVDIENMNEDSRFKYLDVLKAKVCEQIYDFIPIQIEEIEFITTLIEKSSCQFTRNLARQRLYKVVKRISDRFYGGNYARNSSYRSGFPREDRQNSQKEFNNPSPKKRFSYEESRNRGENPSRGDGFSNRHKSALPQRERRTSQEEYSSLSEKHSSRDAEISSKGVRNFIRDEKHSNKDDDYSRGGRNFSKVEGHSNRDDNYHSNRGGRNFGKRYSNKNFEYSRRDEEHSNRNETFSSRGYKSNRRGNSSRPPRLSGRSEGNSSRGQAHYDRGEHEQKADLSH